MKDGRPSPLPRLVRSAALGVAVLLGVVVYAYGFEVTKVDLAETRSERRQTQLVRILRALAHPDIIEFPQAEIAIDAPFFMPCPQTPTQLHEPNPRQTYLLLRPDCTEPGGEIEVEGFNFEPNSTGNVFLIPPSQVELRLGQASADGAGHFLTQVQLPERSSDVVQSIRVIFRQNVGTPRLTRTAYDTWDKIVETVFMAFLATTLSTAIAVPLSFLAARNLMKGIRTPLMAISLSILTIPVGVLLGAAVARLAAQWGTSLAVGLPMNLAGAVISPLAVWAAARWALPAVETAPPGLGLRIARGGALIAAGALAIFGMIFLAEFLLQAGPALAEILGPAAFLGDFVYNLGEILQIGVVAGTALVGGGLLAGAGGRFGKVLSRRLSKGILRVAEFVVSMAAGAALLVGLGLAIDWFYEIHDPMVILVAPGTLGAVIGFVLALRFGGRDTLPIGLVLYAIARTIFNALRSIEALIMVIVFAVWVGIGPFAGVLALSLHSIAALAKLYSEQVESILPGPLEAVTATGATRMQTIVYAVVPQIIPPYISFTMYRWDINVRMSTIIGFAGGGGIGFLLQQNINLLNYRAASAQMLAIAVVVAAMDYLSSYMRERVV
jgi:phosphonate ABC transporter permease subunit PhnE